MNSKFKSALSGGVKKLSFLGFGFFMMLSNLAHAVLINFDELNASAYEEGPYGFPTPLRNEYESQGLVFNYAAYLLEWSGSKPIVSSPNYVGGPGFSFEFVGELPTAVSFYLGSSAKMAVFIDVLGPDYANHLTSSGENHGGWPEEYGSPYIPNELFTFYSATGISSVEFSGRGDVFIDDLTYNYSSQTQVPEPSTFILFVIGLLGLLSSHFKFTFDSCKTKRRLL
jgi:hypothetical protein